MEDSTRKRKPFYCCFLPKKRREYMCSGLLEAHLLIDSSWVRVFFNVKCSIRPWHWLCKQFCHTASVFQVYCFAIMPLRFLSACKCCVDSLQKRRSTDNGKHLVTSTLYMLHAVCGIRTHSPAYLPYQPFAPAYRPSHLLPHCSAEPIAAGASEDGTPNAAEEASRRLKAAHAVKDVLAAAQEHLLVGWDGSIDDGVLGVQLPWPV